MARFVEKAFEVPAVIAFIRAAEAGASDLPPLYATLKVDYPGRDRNGAVKKLLAGQRVRVTDHGKFGDFGVTTDIMDDEDYEARFTIAELSDYSDKP